MPENGNERKRGILDYIVWTSLFLLALKALGLMQLWFNIDPPGFDITIDLGSAISLVLFGLLWNRLGKLESVVTSQGTQIAYLKGKSEVKR